MRIALLSYRSKAHSGGQGVYVRHLSRELVALGHEVEVLSGQPYPDLDAGVTLTKVPSLDLYREPDPFRRPHWREFGSAVDVLEYALMCTAAFPEPLTFSLRAARILTGRSARPDVVHDNQTLGYGTWWLERRGFRVVATVHHPITVDRRIDLAGAVGARRRFALRRWYSFLPMQARVARRLSSLITVSTSSHDDVVRDFGVDPARIRVVPVGVDAEVFTPPDAPRVPGRLVVTASADVPQKGLVPLLEALAKLRTERDVNLVVVGRCASGGATDLAVQRLGLGEAVRFVHGISDSALAQLLGSASVAVVPSLYEGFSLPAVEAMACGTPLVASTGGALPEVVGPDGLTALHVPPGNAEALTGAISRVLDDPVLGARMGERGRARVLQHFTWRSTAAQTVAAYQRELDRTPDDRPSAAPC